MIGPIVDRVRVDISGDLGIKSFKEVSQFDFSEIGILHIHIHVSY